jgi:CBS domain-containing protein
MTLREVLHAHIPILTSESTVRDAVDKMDVYQFPALVIVDPEMRPTAVLTEGDLCRAVTQQESLIQLAEQPAYVYASKEPTTATADTEIGDAFHKMLMSGLTLLPVTDLGRLAGVVLRVDLMQAMLVDVQAEA